MESPSLKYPVTSELLHNSLPRRRSNDLTLVKIPLNVTLSSQNEEVKGRSRPAGEVLHGR